MVSRRDFMGLLSLMVCYPREVLASRFVGLRAGSAEVGIVAGGGLTKLWGYNGLSPGPLLKAKKGDFVRVRFENGLSESSSVHWHGVRIDNRMDGVVGLTQKGVVSGESFDYEFRVPDAGTYWYHSHDRSWKQVARGLYGVLVVEEEDPPFVAHDMVVCVDDWRVNREGEQRGDYDNMHDMAHDGRLGNVRGAIFQGIEGEVKRNQRVRMRVVNTATARIFRLRFEGIEGKIVSYDGMPLEEVEDLGEVVLGPSQRCDVIADVRGERVVVYDGDWLLGGFRVEGEEEGVAGVIEPLPQNRYSVPDMGVKEEVPLRMEGGAMSAMMMRGMMGSMMGGDNNFWAFNGVSGMEEAPLRRFSRGETGMIMLINETRFPHAIHLHGHHFQTVSPKGELGPLRDTVLVEAGERQKIVCVFDNPGKWLFHCHMLGHQVSGMVTWIDVV